MKIVESFYSIQGEGALSGRLSFFIRVAGCNLNCIGFGCTREHDGATLVGCDTLRAVYTDRFDSEYQDYDERALFSRICALPPSAMIVITGGEPLLYQRELYPLVCRLLDSGRIVCFESNGTIALKPSYPRYKECIFALSIKLRASGAPRVKRIVPSAICSFSAARQVFYKFVIDGENTDGVIDEIDEILAVQRYDVYCMPLGSTRAQLERGGVGVFEFCLRHGFNYSDRLHIRLFDNQEGI